MHSIFIQICCKWRHRTNNKNKNTGQKYRSLDNKQHPFNKKKSVQVSPTLKVYSNPMNEFHPKKKDCIVIRWTTGSDHIEGSKAWKAKGKCGKVRALMPSKTKSIKYMYVDISRHEPKKKHGKTRALNTNPSYFLSAIARHKTTTEKMLFRLFVCCSFVFSSSFSIDPKSFAFSKHTNRHHCVIFSFCVCCRKKKSSLFLQLIRFVLDLEKDTLNRFKTFVNITIIWMTVIKSHILVYLLLCSFRRSCFVSLDRCICFDIIYDFLRETD